jgi:hypothetical protein
MMVTLTTPGMDYDQTDTGPWLVLKDGEWFFEWWQLSQNQGPQPKQKGPDEVEEPFRLPKTTVLRKAEREEVIRWVKKHFVVVGVEDAAAMLDSVEETIYRMVKRGELGRVQGTRHVKIPLEDVINLTRGLNKDGTKRIL